MGDFERKQNKKVKEIEKIISSFLPEETGYQKPQIEFFNYVFSNVENFEKPTSLIIGDSITADIMGGFNAGIDTCWFNRYNQTVDVSIQPTYVLRNLHELVGMLS